MSEAETEAFAEALAEAHTEARAERARRRRSTWEGNVASTFEEAERWDLEFWQRRTPQERLSALVAIHRDYEALHGGWDALTEDED